MIALGMMMVIGLCASADTIMEWTDKSSIKNKLFNILNYYNYEAVRKQLRPFWFCMC